MTTALDIITRAMKSIGVLDAIEVPTADQAADGLVALNDMLESWANQFLLIYTDTAETVSCNGSGVYTVGASGTWNITRPIKLRSAVFSLNNINYPLEIVTFDEFFAIPDLTVTGSIPSVIYLNISTPWAAAYLYPIPPSGDIYLQYDAPFTSFASLTDTVSLPVGYERALRLNLAVELMPEFGVQNQQVMQMAREAKQELKRTNSKSRVLTTNLPRRFLTDSTGIAIKSGAY